MKGLCGFHLMCLLRHIRAEGADLDCLDVTTKVLRRVGKNTVEVGAMVRAGREVPARVLDDLTDEAEVAAIIDLVAAHLALTVIAMPGKLENAIVEAEAEAAVIAAARVHLIIQAYK